MSDNAPRSPSDPRPNDEPYYIDSDCECGATLVQYDEYHAKTVEDGQSSGTEGATHDTDREPWYDEWWCPDCDEGIHMDWPHSHWDDLTERADSDEWVTLDELADELDIDLEDDDD